MIEPASIRGTFFDALVAEDALKLGRVLEQEFLAGGEVLCRQGEPGDALFVVEHGRLRATREDPSGRAQVLGEIGRGEAVGELSLLTGEPRSATVVALRDTSLLRLPKAAFDDLAVRSPEVTLALARLIARRAGDTRRKSAALPATITLFPCGKGEVDMRAFCDRLLAALAPRRPVLVDRAFAQRTMGASANVTARADHGVSFARLLEDLEARHALIVYLAERGNTPWTRHCVRQADRILLVVSGDDPGLSEAEAQIAEQHGEGLVARQELVRVLPDDARVPADTAAWLAPRAALAHHHVRLGEGGDFARLARLVAGRAIGVAMSGGGVLGMAHVGLLRALKEASVPVDLVAGTSVGSIVAAHYARRDDPDAIVDHMMELVRRNVFDPTLPLLSLFAGRRFERFLRRGFGEARLEDTWRPGYVVSADLIAAEAVVHDRGPAWLAVRASTSLPTILPPVRLGDRLLVDGGVLNNLPTDVVRARGGAPLVIASDVAPFATDGWTGDRDVPVSGLRLLWRRLRGRPVLPGIGDVIARAAMLAAVRHQVSVGAAAGDLSFLPPNGGYGILQVKAIPAIYKAGYEAARRAVEGWLASGQLSVDGWAQEREERAGEGPA